MGKKKEEIMYSMSEPGYQAWLADGKKGTFEDFLEEQARISDKEYLIEEIVAELQEMNIEELKELLGSIEDGRFLGG